MYIQDTPPKYSIIIDKDKRIGIKKDAYKVSNLIHSTIPFGELLDKFMSVDKRKKMQHGKQLKKGPKKKIIVVNE